VPPIAARAEHGRPGESTGNDGAPIGPSGLARGYGLLACRGVEDRTGQPVAGSRDGLDLEEARCDFRRNFANLADGPVETVVADHRPAPAFVKQLVAGDDPAGGIE